MASFWPTPLSDQENPGIADKMNRLQKFVFSKTLDSVSWGSWNNIRLVKDKIAPLILKMKSQPGKDMVIFGGANLATAFMGMDLVDEYKLFVNPILLGQGTPLFQEGLKRSLSLVKTERFGCGNVLLSYRSEKD